MAFNQDDRWAPNRDKELYKRNIKTATLTVVGPLEYNRSGKAESYRLPCRLHYKDPAKVVPIFYYHDTSVPNAIYVLQAKEVSPNKLDFIRDSLGNVLGVIDIIKPSTRALNNVLLNSQHVLDLDLADGQIFHKLVHGLIIDTLVDEGLEVEVDIFKAGMVE